MIIHPQPLQPPPTLDPGKVAKLFYYLLLKITNMHRVHEDPTKVALPGIHMYANIYKRI